MSAALVGSFVQDPTEPAYPGIAAESREFGSEVDLADLPIERPQIP